MAPTSSTLSLLPCSDEHIPQIKAILDHYVRNTVITFALTSPSQQQVLETYRAVIGQRLPYVVAINQDHDVLGFAYATGFNAYRKGYRHTVELSLFCHHEHTARGLGPLLLHKLIDILKTPHNFPDYVAQQRSDDDKVRMVLTCMAVDETAWNRGLGLRDFYVKHGFDEVGHFRKVGHKFDRWCV